jgi:hypothetical protein
VVLDSLQAQRESLSEVTGDVPKIPRQDPQSDPVKAVDGAGEFEAALNGQESNQVQWDGSLVGCRRERGLSWAQIRRKRLRYELDVVQGLESEVRQI